MGLTDQWLESERVKRSSFSTESSFSLTKISSNSISNTPNLDNLELTMRYRRPSLASNTCDVPNAPIIPSPYDEKMRRWLHLNPQLYTNRVYIPWYRRYTDAIPEREQQIPHQPYKEIQARDEDIALQHQFGYHECMHEYVSRGFCQLPAAECKRIRDSAVVRYDRFKKREAEKLLKIKKNAPAADENAFVLPGQDIDLTSEFGFSANKKKLVEPAVDFLLKLHAKRERAALRERINPSSKWLMFKNNPGLRQKLKILITENKKNAARSRIKRLFSLVLCVNRFIKCVAMISGDTQTLLKDTTQWSQVEVRLPKESTTRLEKEVIFFKVHNYMKVGQVQVPFHIQLILGKPWFIRTNKEVETAVHFLEAMRCFTAYPRPFQYVLARVAWYIELPTQKVVIRQSHQAVNFYLLLHGSVRIDRLEGSPCEEENGHFRTLKNLSSQDMFGDECITEPFGERTYTATTEEKCAALDFNMHDYNLMIQQASTTEEAPDHIRFLCKLRIMDNFPKIKLLQEQDNNVTYFFFRSEMLVCKSVRDSPYVFVIRNGSCSTLRELKPRNSKSHSTRASSYSSGRSSRQHGRRLIPSIDANRPGSLGSIASSNVSERSGLRGRALPSRDMLYFEKLIDQQTCTILEDAENLRTLQERSKSLSKSLSNEFRQRFNLDSKQPLSKEEDVGLDMPGDNMSTHSFLKWEVDTEHDRAKDIPERMSIYNFLEKRQSIGSGYGVRRTSTSKTKFTSSTNVKDKRASIGSDVSKASTLNTSRRSSQNIRASTPKITGTNIPMTYENIMTKSRSNTNNNANVKDWQSALSGNRIDKTKGKSQPASKPTAKSQKRGSQPDVPPSRYSQWCEKAVLTVTDVAGVEWLDYNDGNYNPPNEDVSLVSHGATIIMIKKNFMLKYLRKVW